MPCCTYIAVHFVGSRAIEADKRVVPQSLHLQWLCLRLDCRCTTSTLLKYLDHFERSHAAVDLEDDFGCQLQDSRLVLYSTVEPKCGGWIEIEAASRERANLRTIKDVEGFRPKL